MGLVKNVMAEKLNVNIYDTRKSMGEAAAADVIAEILSLAECKDEINIIFASAPSQNEFLAKLASAEDVPWQKVNAFHLDEYIGLEPAAPQGFGNFLKNKLFGKVPLKAVYYMDGNAPDLNAECLRYTKILEEYPADIVCIGVGENGHIAFNDPHVANFQDIEIVKMVKLDYKCRLQQVSENCFETLKLVPTDALTVTIPPIVQADRVFCVVPGKNKADAIHDMLYGAISEVCPASILRTIATATLYLDIYSAGMA